MSRRILLAAALLSYLGACSDSADSVLAPNASPRPSAARLEASAAATGTSTIVSALGAKLCADIAGAGTAPGTDVILWECHGGGNQNFTFEATGEIKVYNGTMCLDAWTAQGNDGDKLVVWPCHGGANQKWTRTAAGEIVGINGKCLDVWGASREFGTKLVIWSCHGGTNQKWTMTGLDAAIVPPPQQQPDAASDGVAELPRTYLDTRMPGVTGRSIQVPSGGNLQAALDAAQPGDEVVLPAGSTFVGNYTLRPKAGMGASQWITVRSSGQLPAEGTRVGPGNAGQLAKILTPSVAPAIGTAPGAQGWRLVGLEVAPTPTLPWGYVLVAFGTSGAEQSTAAQVPSRLVLDRSYLHGSSTFDVRRCIVLNSAASAVIDSYIADCHSNDSESQGILGWNGPGPFKIVNNHIEGGHEVLMFGGADPSVPGVLPSDIEIRRNHIMRPLGWRRVWGAKNLLELKMGQRLLVEGNVFENNWADAQTGFAFVWSTNNQDGGCTWCVTQDVTFRYNRVRNTAGGFNLAPFGTGTQGRVNPGAPMRRVTIAHNVITGLDASNGRLYQIGALGDLTIASNSGLGVTHNLIFTNEPSDRLPGFTFRNNVTGGEYSLFLSGIGMGAPALAVLQIPTASVAGNVIYSGQGAWTVPTGNTFASSVGTIGFVDLAGGNLRLGPASPFRAAGTGGSVPGADIDRLDQLTADVVR